MPSYSWDAAASDGGEDKPKKENDHATDALRYAWDSTRSVWRNLIVPPEAPPNLEDTFGVAL